MNFWLDPDRAAHLVNGFLEANSRPVLIGDGSIFEYMYNITPDDPLKSFWIFNFYQHSIWTVGTRGPQSTLPEGARAPEVSADGE